MVQPRRADLGGRLGWPKHWLPRVACSAGKGRGPGGDCIEASLSFDQKGGVKTKEYYARLWSVGVLSESSLVGGERVAVV